MREPRPPIAARFDDLTPGGASFELVDPVGVIIADAPHEVAQTLREAENWAKTGHWLAGFVTYEAAAGLDPTLPVSRWPAGHPLADLPLAWFAAFTGRQEVPPPDKPPAPADSGEVWRLDRDAAWHRAAVTRAQHDIAAGDYYQLNLTASLSTTVADPAALYARLCTEQRGAYHALINTGRHTVVSASPELFLRRSGDTVTTRPMKGTAPRGRWPADDRAQAAALHASAKDRAENVMIVDLLRNDLARVAATGTVRVPALFALERYPTVWQLTSTVTADLAGDLDLAELFGALFPSGSITGAPKRAAMTAIAAGEGRARGVYCGAVGYLEPCAANVRPAAVFSVAIRTATCAPDGRAEYGAGGGVTAGSTAPGEWAELLSKTAVLRRSPRPPGLLETLRYEPPTPQRTTGVLVNLARHVGRLKDSADYFGFSCDPDEVAAAVAAATGRRDALGRVRVLLRADGAVTVEVAALTLDTDRVRLGIAPEAVRSDDVLLFHKQSDRSRYDAVRAAHPGFADVLLTNERGELTETTVANVAIRLAATWWTPPLECGLLPGVERARLLELGELAERTLTVADLAAAEAIAVLSSLRGWRPATLR